MLYGSLAVNQRFSGEIPNNNVLENCRNFMGGNNFMASGGEPMFVIHGVFSILFGLALFAIIVISAVGVYHLIKKRPVKTSKTSETALEILRKRYAEGSITTEEFLERKKHLE